MHREGREMPQLETPIDHVRTAAEVWAAAIATHRRRVSAYERFLATIEPPAKTPQPVEPGPPPAVPKPPSVPWEDIRNEVARRARVERGTLLKDGGRKLQTAALRQLALALTRKLTAASFPVIGRLYGVDHSTAIHAVRRMAAILDATGLTEADSVPVWVEAALPLLFVHIGEHRRACANRAVPLDQNGKFATQEDARC
jgi:Bacterial dnaA protein helix-turn-helix